MPPPAERAGRPVAPDGNLQPEPRGIPDEHSRQLPLSAREMCRKGGLAHTATSEREALIVIKGVHALSQTLGQPHGPPPEEAE